jgi:hypothetical protein
MDHQHATGVSGLRRICKMYGAITIEGVKWVWDYVKDKPVKKSDMTTEEWRASERKKYELVMAQKERTEDEPTNPF